MPFIDATISKAHDRATNVLEHYLGPWAVDVPSKGLWTAKCDDCGMTVEVHPSGHYLGPAVTEICPRYLRALAEYREGVSDALDQSPMDDD